MRRGRIPSLVLAAASLWFVGGCAGQNSLFTSRTTVGSLRTSLSHLQHDNEQLKRQVADLKAESHNLEDQLVQEEARNGDLAARLDDARHALRAQDGDGSTSAFDSEPPSRTLPAGRSTKKKRKPPFAQIPGQPTDTAPPASDDEGVPVKDLRGDAGGSGWTPVARGSTSPLLRVR